MNDDLSFIDWVDTHDEFKDGTHTPDGVVLDSGHFYSWSDLEGFFDEEGRPD